MLSELKAGFDYSVTLSDLGYLVEEGFTPKFIIGGPSSLIAVGEVIDDDITFSIAASETSEFATGQYWYQVVAETEPESSSSSSSVPVSRTFIEEGTLWVIAKISGTGIYDGRSVAEKIIEAIDLTIQGKATADQQSYVIQSGSGSRSLSRMSLEDLMIARKYYAGIVSAEKRKKGGQPLFKKHQFEFVKP